MDGKGGFACLLAGLLLMAGCREKAQDRTLHYSPSPATKQAKRYRLAPHPLYSPQSLRQLFQPLIDHLNRRIPQARFELESSRNYGIFERKYRDRQAEVILPNPWQTLDAMKAGYRVAAMWGDAADFKGILLVRKDGGIRTPSDLKGKVVSYPSPTALAAAMLPQYFLHQHGIDIRKDLHNSYVGSQEASIMSVLLGQSAAGATWPPPWRLFQKQHPREARELKLIWETPSLINNSVMVRDDVPEDIRQRLVRTLLELKDTPEGRQILAVMETSGFYPADDASYRVVLPFVRRFEAQVRPVDLE